MRSLRIASSRAAAAFIDARIKADQKNSGATNARAAGTATTESRTLSVEGFGNCATAVTCHHRRSRRLTSTNASDWARRRRGRPASHQTTLGDRDGSRQRLPHAIPDPPDAHATRTEVTEGAARVSVSQNKVARILNDSDVGAFDKSGNFQLL